MSNLVSFSLAPHPKEIVGNKQKTKHLRIRMNRIDLPVIIVIIFIQGIRTNFGISFHCYTLVLLNQGKIKGP